MNLSSIKKYSAFSIILVMSFIAASCATQKDIIELNANMNARNSVVDARFVNIENSLASIESLISEQQMLSKDIRALMGTQESEQRDMIASIIARQDDINYQLRELMDKLQAIQLYGGISAQTPSELPGTQTTSSGASSTPVTAGEIPLVSGNAAETNDSKAAELFDLAVADVNQGNHVLAESRFLTFLIQFPKHERAGDAQFYLGKVAFDQKKYDLAVTEIEKLIKQYPKSAQIPPALLMKGLSEIEVGHKISASTTFKKLISTYPNSDEAEEAKEKLDSL